MQILLCKPARKSPVCDFYHQELHEGQYTISRVQHNFLTDDILVLEGPFESGKGVDWGRLLEVPLGVPAAIVQGGLTSKPLVEDRRVQAAGHLQARHKVLVVVAGGGVVVVAGASGVV